MTTLGRGLAAIRAILDQGHPSVADGEPSIGKESEE